MGESFQFLFEPGPFAVPLPVACHGELAEKLGVTQSVVSDYERDVLRLNSELIMQLIGILNISADELLGVAKTPTSTAPIKNRRLYRQLQSIDKLPKRDQQALLRTIDAFLSKAS